jgi:hypothetical protein
VISWLPPPKYIDKERLGSTDDCGFSPFSIDKKPNHGNPDYARDVAFQKIANRVAGTRWRPKSLAFIETGRRCSKDAWARLLPGPMHFCAL